MKGEIFRYFNSLIIPIYYFVASGCNPLSHFLGSLEEEILRLEVAEEEKRKSGSWSQYKEEIDLM